MGQAERISVAQSVENVYGWFTGGKAFTNKISSNKDALILFATLLINIGLHETCTYISKRLNI